MTTWKRCIQIILCHFSSATTALIKAVKIKAGRLTNLNMATLHWQKRLMYYMEENTRTSSCAQVCGH